MKLFVAGTDTGVGKTLISAALTLKYQATYWKPIQAGLPTDTDWVKAHTGCQTLPEAYRLLAPLSPHAAAKREGISISLSKIVCPAIDPLIIEGAGGVLVPLNEKELMIDLIEQLNVPVLIVARSTLGTLNHTLMTLSQLRLRQIPIAGVVLNGPKNPENKAAIEHFGRVRVIAEIEPLARLEQEILTNLIFS